MISKTYEESEYGPDLDSLSILYKYCVSVS